MKQLTARRLAMYTALLVLLFVPFNASLRGYLGLNRLTHLLYFSVPFFVYCYRNSGTVFRCQKNILIVLLAAFFLIYWRAPRYGTLDEWQIPYVSLFISMLLLHEDEKWWDIFWKVVRFYCTFHLVTGLILLTMPEFQLNYIVPMFGMDESSQTYRTLIRVIRQGYMTGLTDHYSKMGMYLALGTIAYAKPLLSGGCQVRLRDWFAFAAFMVGLIMTGKRGPFLFAVLAIVFVYWLVNRPFTVKQYRRVFFLLAGIAAAIPVLYVAVPQFRTLLARFLMDGGDANDLSSGRIELFWVNAIKLFTEKPIFGYGWRKFRVLNQSRFGYNGTNDSHNIYLQLAAETGIVGLMVFLTIFIGSFLYSYRAFKMQKKYRVLNNNQLLSLELAMAYQVNFLLYGLTGNPLYDSMCYIPYFMCCSIGYAAWYRLKQVQRLEKKRRYSDEKIPILSQRTIM